MQLNFAGREITIKLVYYGPALSGKTTNLKALHELTADESHGRLMTLETRDDRTLFFDMLPLVFRAGDRPRQPGDRSYTPVDPTMGMSLRIKVFTVPGQVLHGATRRLVLQGADGVAFVADSQLSETENNAASFLDLRSNLKELNVSRQRRCRSSSSSTSGICPHIRSDDELKTLAQQGREPVFRRRALSGEGVRRDVLRFAQPHVEQARGRAPAVAHHRNPAAGVRAGRGAEDGDQARRVGDPRELPRRQPRLPRAARHAPKTEAQATEPTSSDIDATLRLEDLVNREALVELLRQLLHALRHPGPGALRGGTLLADSAREHERLRIHQHVR